jgi:type I restriction enzyme S subunit
LNRSIIKLEHYALPKKGAIVSGPFGSNIGSRFFVKEGVPIIRGNNLTKGDRRFIDDGFVFLTEEKAAEFKNCEATTGDLVFTAAGTIGQVGVIPQNSRFERYIISNKQLRFRCDAAKANPWFLYYWFCTPEMRQYLISQNKGSSVPLINLSVLRNLPVPDVSLAEQDNIANLVSAYDDLIENNLRRMQLLEEAALQLYREWFVRLRFPGREHTRIVNGLPEGWERTAFEKALVLQRGFDLPIQAREEGVVAVYGSTGINGFHNKAKVQGPGVITGRSGTLGEVHYVSRDFWPLNTALWVKEFKAVTPLFALFLLREMDLKQYNGGVSVPSLDRKAVHRVEILVPPKKLIAIFEEFAIPLFIQIDNLAAQNEKLRTARDLLLPRLMSGEIAV